MSGPTEPAVTEYREALREGYAAIRPYMARWVPAKAWPAVIESDGSNLAEVVDLIHRSPALLRGADPGSAQAPKIRAVVNIARSASEMVRWAGHVHLMHQKGHLAEARASASFAQIYRGILAEDVASLKRLERWRWFRRWLTRRS